LLKKRTKREDDDDEVQPIGTKKEQKTGSNATVKALVDEKETECNFGNFNYSENVIKKIDYDSLELMLYQNRISDYHDLVDKINLWAVNLGFLIKLRRPPKMN